MVIVGVTVAVALGAISPGPSFIVVARTAVSSTAGTARITAAGIATASLVFSILAVTGISAVLVYAAWLFVTLKIGGGAYLLYVGIRLWRRPAAHHESAPPTGPVRAFMSGFLTQLSNPKTVIIYGSVFAALLPAHPTTGTLIALPIATTTTELTWYLLVGTVLALPAPQRLYARSVVVVDRVAGTFLGALGVFFAVDGIRQAVK